MHRFRSGLSITMAIQYPPWAGWLLRTTDRQLTMRMDRWFEYKFGCAIWINKKEASNDFLTAPQSNYSIFLCHQSIPPSTQDEAKKKERRIIDAHEWMAHFVTNLGKQSMCVLRATEICHMEIWEPLKDASYPRKEFFVLWFVERYCWWWQKKKYELLIFWWNISIIPMIIEVINKFRFFSHCAISLLSFFPLSFPSNTQPSLAPRGISAPFAFLTEKLPMRVLLNTTVTERRV